jgi:hypothetical protein
MITDRIADICSDMQRACCQFRYRGYLISYSTVFAPHHTKIFDDEHKEVTLIKFTTVEQAIVFVDAHIDEDAEAELNRAWAKAVKENCGY